MAILLPIDEIKKFITIPEQKIFMVEQKEKLKEEKPKEEIKKEKPKELGLVDKIFKGINDSLIKSKISSGELMLIILYITEGFVAATITAKTAEVHPAVRVLLHLIAAIISVYAGLNMIPSIEEIFKTFKSRFDYTLMKFIIRIVMDIIEAIIYTIIALTSPFLVFMLIASGLNQMDRVQYLFNNAGIFNIVEWFSILNYTLNGTYLAMIFHYMLLLVVSIGYGKKYIKIEPVPEKVKEEKKDDKSKDDKPKEDKSESKPAEDKKEEKALVPLKPEIPAGLVINSVIFDIPNLKTALRGFITKYDVGGSEYANITNEDVSIKIKSKLKEFHSFLKFIFPNLPITPENLLYYVLRGKNSSGIIPTFEEVLKSDPKAFDTISANWFNNTLLQSVKPFIDKLEKNQEINKHFLQSILTFSNSVIKQLKDDKAFVKDNPAIEYYIIPGSDPSHFLFVNKLLEYTNSNLKK